MRGKPSTKRSRLHEPLKRGFDYNLCESASGTGIWHIRKIGRTGPHFGGGIDTPFLCGCKYLNGWDLEVPITIHHLMHCCRYCMGEFNKITGDIDTMVEEWHFYDVADNDIRLYEWLGMASEEFEAYLQGR